MTRLSGASRSRTAGPRAVRRSAGLVALALPFLLTACVTDTGGSGAAPPTLSANCQRSYQSYLQERTPGFFVTDVSGRICGYNYCPAAVTDCRAAYPGPILRSCEEQSGLDCYIYARGRTINWQGPPTGK